MSRLGGQWFRSFRLDNVAANNLDILVPIVEPIVTLSTGTELPDSCQIIVVQRIHVNGTAAVAGKILVESVEDPLATATPVRVLDTIAFITTAPVNYLADWGDRGIPCPGRSNASFSAPAKLRIRSLTEAGVAQNLNAMFLNKPAHISIQGYRVPFSAAVSIWDSASFTAGA